MAQREIGEQNYQYSDNTESPSNESEFECEGDGGKGISLLNRKGKELSI